MSNQKLLAVLLLSSTICAGLAAAQEQNLSGKADQNPNAPTTLDMQAQQFAQEEEDLTVRQNQMQLLDEEEAAQGAKQQQLAMSLSPQQTDTVTVIIVEGGEE